MSRVSCRPCLPQFAVCALLSSLLLTGCGGGSGGARFLTVTGFVTDAALRTPLPGAVVTAQGETTTAGSDGFFTLRNLTGGTVRVTINATSYQPLVLDVSLRGGSLALGKVYLSPTHVAGTGNVRGQITLGGAPAVAALVFIGTARAQTGEAGDFALFNAPAGLQTLTAASADRARIGQVQVTVPADGEVTGISIVLQGGPPPPPL